MINKNDLLKLVDKRINDERLELLFAKIDNTEFVTELQISSMEEIKDIIVKMKEV